MENAISWQIARWSITRGTLPSNNFKHHTIGFLVVLLPSRKKNTFCSICLTLHSYYQTYFGIKNTDNICSYNFLLQIKFWKIFWIHTEKCHVTTTTCEYFDSSQQLTLFEVLDGFIMLMGSIKGEYSFRKQNWIFQTLKYDILYFYVDNLGKNHKQVVYRDVPTSMNLLFKT